MIIYVSAPYTRGCVLENVRRACLAGDEILRKGHTPFIPHLFYIWDFMSPKARYIWLQIGLDFLNFCSAIVRLEGESEGADIELKEANKLCMIIYNSLEEIPYVS